MGKVFVFDNNTGIDIPEKINETPVEMLFGDTLSKVKENIDGNADLFCVFTTILEADIIVPNEIDKRFLDSILKFTNEDLMVKVKESSIWYSDIAKKNIIFDHAVALDSSKLQFLIETYLSKVKEHERSTPKQENPDMYIVIHFRNGRELIRTPNFEEAKKMCDKNPCSIIVNRSKETVYESRHGRVSVPYTKENHTNQHRARLNKLNKESPFKIQ